MKEIPLFMEPMNPESKRRKTVILTSILVGGLVIAVAIAISAFFYLDVSVRADDQDMTSEHVAEPIKEADGFQLFLDTEMTESRLKNQYQPDRDSYGTGKVSTDRSSGTFEISNVFTNLPPVPDDFWRYKYEIMSGKISVLTLSNMSDDYYQQPELYGDSFKKVFPAPINGQCEKGILDDESGECLGGCIAYWKKPDTTHQYTEGYAVFPLEVGLSMKPGSQTETYTFIKSSCGVQTYQGFSIAVEYPDWGVNFDGSRIDVDPEKTQEYFTVEVTPEFAVLSPAYPVYEDGWAKKVQLKIKANENAEPGYYSIGLNLGKAPESNEMVWQNKYREKYQSKSGFVVTPTDYPSFFNVLIEVRGGSN